MPRNNSGTMSVVNTLVAGTTITAAAHNQNYADIGNEITNSLAVDGQSTMTGQIKAANGLVSAPGIAFGSELDCGWYRIGTNNIGLTLGGSKVVDYTTSGISITGTLTSSGALTVSGGGAAITGNSSVTGTLTVSSTLTAQAAVAITGNVAVNTDKFTVNASNGNAAVGGTLGVTGAATFSAAVSAASIAGSMIASQAQMEAGSATDVVATPGRLHFHRGVEKAGGKFAGATGTLASGSNNVASVVRDSEGDYTVTFTTAFSSADYEIQLTALDASNARLVRVRTQAAGSFTIKSVDVSGSDVDPGAIYFSCFGDI